MAIFNAGRGDRRKSPAGVPGAATEIFADRGDKITPETVKVPTLLLVEDCVTSRPKHLARGHYNRDAIFQNACVAFCQCYTEINKLD